MSLFNSSIINSVFSFLSLAGWLLLIFVTAIWFDAAEKNKKLKNSLDKLEGAFKDLDEQAKLIVKTDLELNKTQEELDKKISGLYTLHKLSQAMSTTLIEEEVFRKIKDELILELGFEKCLIFFFKGEYLDSKLDVGYSDKEFKNIQLELEDVLKNKNLKNLLFVQNMPVSSNKLERYKVLSNKIIKTLGLALFIFCPIRTKEDLLGIIIMGNSSSAGITEGDEDTVAILANQIAQTIENARLFEQTWRSHQELEQRVRERTRELSEAFEEIKKVSKRKSDFISAVSHELRTP